MSVHVANGLTYEQGYALAVAIRETESAINDPIAGTWTYTYTPDLSAAEVTAFDDFVRTYRTWDVQMTVDEYRALKPHLQVIRDLRQMGRNAFMALTAAERDRLLYDAQAATTTILLAVLRE